MKQLKRKYGLLSWTGYKLEGITIDESAKKDFRLMMGWNEAEWKRISYVIKSKPLDNKHIVCNCKDCKKLRDEAD